MANSLNLEGGGDAASVHRSFTDISEEPAPGSSLQFSNGSVSFVADDAADSSANSTENCFAAPVEESTRENAVQEFDEYEAVLSNDAEMRGEEVDKQEREGVQINCSTKCGNETQAIEHPELTGPSATGDGKINDGCDGERTRKHQELKEKKQKQRGGRNRRNNEVSYCYPNEPREKKGLMYSRGELEALRFENVEEQKKKWVEVYYGLGPGLVDEYDGLGRACEKDSIPGFDFDPRPQLKKSMNLGVVSKVEGDQLENLNASETSSLPISDEIGSSVAEEDYCEDDDSDEDYPIQRPAFMVAGEPDFDSGPPLDGLEYLRRVRWEAAKIPKVKVAKINKVKEQTLYMPQIPDVMKCPENLLPLKEWEDRFLYDFSQLREAFMRLDLQEPNAETSLKEDFLSQMLDSNNISLNSAEDSTSEAKSSFSSPQSSRPKADRPALSTILKMDSAARTSMLKNRISATTDTESLSYNDTLWLFALCAAIDCPLHANTSAALRSLLRTCASLRAAKTEVDDEIVTLNILATIAGRYFGQMERE